MENKVNKIENEDLLKLKVKIEKEFIKSKFSWYLQKLEFKKSKNPAENKRQIEKEIESLYNSYLSLTEYKSSQKELKKLLSKIEKKILLLLNKKLNYIDDNSFPDNSNILTLDKKIIAKIDGVSKFYYSKNLITRVLENINFEIEEGDFVVILGPSGSGKTTLMNLISGIDKPSFGKVWIDGYHLDEMDSNDLTQFRKNVIGYVFQRYGLLPNLTIFENVLMGDYLGKEQKTIFGKKIYKKTSYTKNEMKRIRKQRQEEYEKNRKKIEKDIYQILDLLEIKQYANKYPYELSGGQKQRTSIARTIAKKPKIIFGDEPTAAVDSEMSHTIIEAFGKINRELNTTVVIITHDEAIANYANKVIYVLDGCIDKIINKEKGQLI